MQILENEDQWLLLALSEHQILDRIEYALTAVGPFEHVPCRIFHGDVEQREQGRHGWSQGVIESQHFASDLFADPSGVVVGLDLEICPQQIDYRQVAGRPAIRDRSAL